MMRSNLFKATALAVLFFTAGILQAAPAAAGADDKPKNIDIVVCLDVSNSMDGLINQAKMKLWDIVNDMAKVQPTPNLRVSLYSYGHNSYDKQAGWVRKESDLTNDLDEIYRKLNGLTTRGGTEYVARVCRDAIKDQKWSEDKDSLKVIFVCGNEPASQDKQVKLKDVAEMAIAKGIVINPIFAGPANHHEAADWKEFAKFAKGDFMNIDQDKGHVVIAAPQDKELNELSRKMSDTYIAYGAQGKEKQMNQVAQDKNAEKAGAGAAPARAASKSSKIYRNDSWDLVDKMNNSKDFDVKKIPEAELCDEMKKMTPDEREAYVKKKAAEREEMQKKIADLSKEREKYIKEEMKKNPSKADQAFDQAIRGALRKQAAEKNIKIPE